MAFSGLLALLDDVASIADDVATLTGMAVKKTSGVVTDDMAVTAEQAIGIRREREIPVVLAVAWGSLKNKCLFLAPGALLLSAVAPWSIAPILMAGGAYLCFEGAEKVAHRVRPASGHGHATAITPSDPEAFERMRVAGAIRTDLILSGEIIAISLGQVAEAPFLTRAATLYAVSVLMTGGVYGVVAGLVKIDDFGELLVGRGGPGARAGRLILAGAPKLLHLISIVGTVAMLMVGGHLVLEGIGPLEEVLHDAVAHAPHGVHGAIGIAIDVVFGALVGFVLWGAGETGLPGAAWRRALALTRGRSR